MADISDADWQDILNTIIAEANGEGPEGMRRVGETILNRAAIRGITPAEVVRQPHQYTGYSAPGPAALRAQSDPRAITAAEAAWQLARQPGDPTNGADHYFNPNVVDPGWENSMTPTGDYKNHAYYSSRPVPAEALAALLAPQAPTPQTMPDTVGSTRARNDALQTLRSSSMAAPDVADMYAGVFETPPQPDLTYPGMVDQSVGTLNQDATTAQGLAAMLTGRSVPAMPMNVAQSYAGQDRSPALAQRPDLSSPGAIDRSVGALGQDTATAAGLAAMLAGRSAPAMPMNVAQSYAGQDRAGSAKAAAGMFSFNGDPGTPAPGRVVADIPSSGVGFPPSTRVVQSVAVNPRRPAETTKSRDAVSNANAGAKTAAMFGDSFRDPQPAQTVAQPFPLSDIPGPTESVVPDKNNARLTPSETALFKMDPPGPMLGYSAFENLFGKDTAKEATKVVAAAKPQTRTITERVENPEWVKAQRATQVPAGMKKNFGSRDTVAQRVAGSVTAGNVPRYITQTKQVPVASPAARMAAPVITPRAPQRVPPRFVVQAQPPSFNPANHSAAQMQAESSGRSYFSNSSGAVEPTRAMNGNLRNTY